MAPRGCRRGPNDDGDMEMAARTTQYVNGAIPTVADVGFAFVWRLRNHWAGPL